MAKIKREVNPFQYVKGQTDCKFRTYDKVKIGDDRCYNCNQLVSITATEVKCKMYGKELI